jgi:hypothetical protein
MSRTVRKRAKTSPAEAIQIPATWSRNERSLLCCFTTCAFPLVRWMTILGRGTVSQEHADEGRVGLCTGRLPTAADGTAGVWKSPETHPQKSACVS